MLAIALAGIVAACGSDDAADTSASPATPDSTVCSPQVEPGVVRESATVDGTERTWQLAMPDGEAFGIIVDLHGTGGTIDVQDAITRLSEEGTERGYVVITPQAEENPARWTVPGIPGPDDVAFVEFLLDDVREKTCATGPAFATGKSSGAAMVTQLACETELFAAVAPVAGINLYRRCPTGSPISVLTFHGTEDTWVPFEGPDGWEEVEAETDTFFIGDPAASVEAFARRADCEEEPTTTEIGTDTTLLEWECRDGREIVSYQFEGAGHTHPGELARAAYKELGVEGIGENSITVEGTEVMLDFFDRTRAALGG